MPKVLFEDTISDTPCRIVLADDATLQCEQASARDAMGSVIWRGIDSHNAQILKSRCILHLYRQHGGTKPDSEDKPAVNSDEILSLLKRHFLSGRRAAPVAALVDGGVEGCSSLVAYGPTGDMTPAIRYFQHLMERRSPESEPVIEPDDGDTIH